MMTFWYNFAVKLCSKQMDGNYPTLPKLGNPYLCFNLPLSVNILLFCKLLRLLEYMFLLTSFLIQIDGKSSSSSFFICK